MKRMVKACVLSEDRTKRAAETNKEKQETLRNIREKYRENKAAVTEERKTGEVFVMAAIPSLCQVECYLVAILQPCHLTE